MTSEHSLSLACYLARAFSKKRVVPSPATSTSAVPTRRVMCGGMATTREIRHRTPGVLVQSGPARILRHERETYAGARSKFRALGSATENSLSGRPVMSKILHSIRSTGQASPWSTMNSPLKVFETPPRLLNSLDIPVSSPVGYWPRSMRLHVERECQVS